MLIQIANRRRKSTGFTFLEIMFVVVIIGILLAVAVPRLTGRSRQAQIRATEVLIRNVRVGLSQYEMDTGVFPTTSQGLAALMERPSNVSEDMWTGPYLEDPPRDPWGNELNYRSPGNHSKDYDLWSNGPDGRNDDGANDDVTSWARSQR